MHSITYIFPLLEACKNVDPGFRLSLRPAAGRQISNCDVALRQYLVTAHDCLMNAAACRTNFHDFTDHQPVIVQSGGSFVADGKIRHSVKALAAFQIVILVDPDTPEHVGSRPPHKATIIGVLYQVDKLLFLKIKKYR